MSHELDTSVFSSPGSTCSHALCRMLWGKPGNMSVLLSGKSSALTQDEKPCAWEGDLSWPPSNILGFILHCSCWPCVMACFHHDMRVFFETIYTPLVHRTLMAPSHLHFLGAELISDSQFHSTMEGCVYILPASLGAR